MASWGASSSKRSFVRPALFLTLFVLFLTVKLVRVQATRHNFQVRDEATEVLASARLVRRSGGEIVGRHLYEDDYDDEGEEDYDDGEFLEDGEYQDEDFVDEEEGGDFFALDGGDEEEYEENLDQEEQERGRGDKKEEEEEEEDEIDLGFDDDDDGEEEEEEEGEGQEEEEGEDFSGEDFYEEDFGDYYDDEDFEEDNGAGADEGEGEGERGREGEDEGVWGFEGGDESFTSFCEGEEGNKRTDIEACDVLVQGLDDNISKTHLHVDGVYKPESCMNGYLRYVPAEGEDARMIAFDVDFEEWGFYNGTEVANENLILHGAQFEARVPQEVEAWYCDVKVCEVCASKFSTKIASQTFSENLLFLLSNFQTFII